jgi:hypothetical protein
MRKASEAKKKLLDPMQRLDAIQRQRGSASITAQAASAASAGYGAPRKENAPRTKAQLLVTRTEIDGALSGGGLHALGGGEPSRVPRAWLGGPGGEVGEELEVASVSDAPPYSAEPVQPLRAFNSAAPNGKLARSTSRAAQQSRAPVGPPTIGRFRDGPPTGAVSGWGTPPGSAHGAPVGAALHVARTARGA